MKKPVSETDGRERIYSNDDPPPKGFDICGRTIIRREEEPLRFARAMRRYRARTGKKINANVWSFVSDDLDDDAPGYRDCGDIVGDAAEELTPKRIEARQSEVQRALQSIKIPEKPADIYADDPKYQAFRALAKSAREKQETTKS